MSKGRQSPPGVQTQTIRIGFTREELVEIRSMSNTLLEMLDQELDNVKNKENSEINRTQQLRQRECLDNIITKVNNSLSRKRSK